jgi:hypothetical protein
MQLSSKQTKSMIRYRVMPVRRNVWRWEVFSQVDDRLLEAGQTVGSKVKAIVVAISAARAWAAKTKP